MSWNQFSLESWKHATRTGFTLFKETIEKNVWKMLVTRAPEQTCFLIRVNCDFTASVNEPACLELGGGRWFELWVHFYSPEQLRKCCLSETTIKFPSGSHDAPTSRKHSASFQQFWYFKAGFVLHVSAVYSDRTAAHGCHSDFDLEIKRVSNQTNKRDVENFDWCWKWNFEPS